MGPVNPLIVRVQPVPDEDDEAVAGLAQGLCVQLLDLDVDSVDPITGISSAEGVKGPGTLIGWMSVHLGKEGLGAVVAAVVNWATRTGHSVEITCDGETLKVAAATSAQQERIIDAYLARHAPRI
jgi:hypothetical protein